MKHAIYGIGFFIVVSIMFLTACGSDSSSPEEIRIQSITELSSIEVRLRWDEAYESSVFIRFLFPREAYAEIPPEYQTHYRHTLTFNHDNSTVSDLLKSFTGIDSSTMITSEVTRQTTSYETFRGYLENTAFLCTVTKDSAGGGGPAPPVITFYLNTGSSYSSYFFDEPMAGRGNTQLCSGEFSDFLLGLQQTRSGVRSQHSTFQKQ